MSARARRRTRQRARAGKTPPSVTVHRALDSIGEDGPSSPIVSSPPSSSVLARNGHELSIGPRAQLQAISPTLNARLVAEDSTWSSSPPPVFDLDEGNGASPKAAALAATHATPLPRSASDSLLESRANVDKEKTLAEFTVIAQELAEADALIRDRETRLSEVQTNSILLVRELERTEEENATLQREVERLEQELEDVQIERRNASRRLSSGRNTLLAQASMAQQRVDELEQENSNLRARLVVFEEHHRSTEELRAELEETRRLLEEKKEIELDLRQHVKVTREVTKRDSNRVSELYAVERISQLERERDDLRARERDLSHRTSELQARQHELRQNISTLEDALAEKDTALRASQVEAEQAKRAVDELTRYWESNHQELTQLHQALQQRYAELEQQYQANVVELQHKRFTELHSIHVAHETIAQALEAEDWSGPSSSDSSESEPDINSSSDDEAVLAVSDDAVRHPFPTPSSSTLVQPLPTHRRRGSQPPRPKPIIPKPPKKKTRKYGTFSHGKLKKLMQGRGSEPSRARIFTREVFDLQQRVADQAVEIERLRAQLRNRPLLSSQGSLTSVFSAAEPSTPVRPRSRNSSVISDSDASTPVPTARRRHRRSMSRSYSISITPAAAGRSLFDPDSQGAHTHPISATGHSSTPPVRRSDSVSSASADAEPLSADPVMRSSTQRSLSGGSDLDEQQQLRHHHHRRSHHRKRHGKRETLKRASGSFTRLTFQILRRARFGRFAQVVERD